MKIENINTNILQKRLKLAIGASMVGILAFGINSITNNNKYNEDTQLVEMTDNIDKASINCNFLNVIKEDENILLFTSDETEGYTSIEASVYVNSGDKTIYLEPGDYQIMSEGTNVVPLKVEDPSQKFAVYIDYSANNIETKEVTESKVK